MMASYKISYEHARKENRVIEGAETLSLKDGVFFLSKYDAKAGGSITVFAVRADLIESIERVE